MYWKNALEYSEVRTCWADDIIAKYWAWKAKSSKTWPSRTRSLIICNKTDQLTITAALNYCARKYNSAVCCCVNNSEVKWNCNGFTTNSSGDEIANLNCLYDDIVYALEIDTCINSATDRFLQRRFTKFSEITQCNGHYAVQGHRFGYQSKAHIRLPISD